MKRWYAFVLVAALVTSGLAAQETPITIDRAFEAVRTYELGQDAAPLQFLVDRVMASHGDTEARRDLANRF
ncbi:MAG TPA: hypothetical protein PKL84_19460, partial [Candidatus Hydrogenedentes bacterium]|nr:hypothetical protein [Candidatus Hydrogenedentota bacterium]